MVKFFADIPISDDFSKKPTPTTMKNPQGNITLERVFQVFSDILRTKNLQYHEFDDMEPWIELLLIVA